MNNEFKNAIELAIIENELNGEGLHVDSNYNVRDINNSERFQVVSEDDIDEACENRCNYDGFPCKSFVFEEVEYFFVAQ